MTTIRNKKQLKAYIEKLSQEILYERRTVFEEIGKNHIETDVYKAYTPDKNNPDSYNRTGKLRESFKTNPTKNGIEITNTRSENGRDIAEIVEKGHYDSQGYEHVKKGAAYLFPRPFMQNTKQEIKDRNLHVTELQKGLKARGIDSKT